MSRPGCAPMLNLATVLESSARDRPGATAITFPGSTFTYAEVDSLANKVAAGLRAAGIEPGQRIALCSPNVPQFIFVYFGIIKAGCVVVPFNVLLAEDEFAYILEDSGAVGFFCFEGTNELPVGETGRKAFVRTEGCRCFWSISLDPQAPDPFPGASTFQS
ncbi:MAG: long-chain fatty acid--CoA ligase, partial [Rhodospirillales bacterium]|nr:long-chain fatty acid--CoA ligase [Rhodospirillales bacterium]